MNPRRRWVWVGYWAGVGLLALVLLGVSGQVLRLEGSEARGRAETARQEAGRLALWRMDSWLAPVLAREARRPYFEYRAVLPADRAYEHMWDPIGTGEPVVASALIAGVPEDEQTTGPSGERLIRLHLQIEPDGRVTSPQHPTEPELVELVLADPMVAANSAQRDRAGALLAVLQPLIEQRVALGSSARFDAAGRGTDSFSRSASAPAAAAPSAAAPSADATNAGEAQNRESVEALSYGSLQIQRSAEGGEYAARSQVAQLAQQAEAPQQQVYNSKIANRLDDRAVPYPVAEPGTYRHDSPTSAGETRSKAENDAEVLAGTAAMAEDELDSITATSVPSESLADAADLSLPEDAARQRAAAGLTPQDEQGLDDDGHSKSRASRSAESAATSADPANLKDVFSETLGRDATERNLGQPGARAGGAGVALGAPVAIRVGAMRPRWLRSASGEPELVYLREVDIEGEVYQQGVWFDWAALRATLLTVSPGLPEGAAIDPVDVGASDQASGAADTQRQLATVPAVLRLPPVGRPALGMTPARWSLVLTWFAVLASVGAIGVVLRTAMRLSDRRVRFVGAVTHELRTPLTTFRLYSQMLADGMVTEESARREYLNTLKQESGRLAGIVENVLAYARLNRAGREQHRVRTEVITPEALLVRLRPGLSRRAEQSGMDLIVSNEAGAEGGRELMVDPQSVERVLTNLVDNACKYAAPAGEDDPDAETRIHLDMRVAGENLEIVVADYGPGIDSADRGKVFGEFQRGRAGQRADRSGLGLGLALSRGLARESGGDLRLVRRRGHGAEFLLTLPMRPGG